MDVPALIDLVRVLGILAVVIALVIPYIKPFVRSFLPVHRWRKRNPYSRQCVRCGFRQDIYADAYGLGYDAEGHQLVEYRGEHLVPDAPKVCKELE